MDEIRKLGGKQIVISSNLELRLDGLPRAAQRTPADQGVAVYFTLNGRSQCFPCDRWSTIEHNLWAIAKSIEALRGLERWAQRTWWTPHSAASKHSHRRKWSWRCHNTNHGTPS
ncbi:MAG: hypothetical protein JNM66_07760 [Bryobacterales bacterium]|nr:hypothetical protein [Bryobacterales bacterium]